jgi:hypothetical protein
VSSAATIRPNTVDTIRYCRVPWAKPASAFPTAGRSAAMSPIRAPARYRQPGDAAEEVAEQPGQLADVQRGDDLLQLPGPTLNRAGRFVADWTSA